MAQNNDVKEQNNSEYTKLLHRMYAQQATESTNAYSTQSLRGTESIIQSDNNNILQQSSSILTTQTSSCVMAGSQSQPASSNTLVFSQMYQESISTSQVPNGLQVPSQQQNVMQTAQNSPYFKAKPLHNDNSQRNVSLGHIENNIPKLSNIQSNMTISPKNSNAYTKTVELPERKTEESRFRVAEFVVDLLDSVPGEERFYNNLSTNLKEKFYAQKINRMNSINNVSHDNMSKVRKREVIEINENDNWIAERDHILKTYPHKLMRKKPRSRASRKLSTDGYLSSDIEFI
ncbi:8172_t:CDS:2 [Funneliformis geosporum]|uniref:19776_t:CDS:1 n=1 Tax=Funneliformis geosporum TaxID=1117311 RepID=A0A9W4SR63_9GLOM|nr:19776_t:CDS:2 [Funneliformis geosporum]CAI2177836.1 8172_t:CDS:2 [Funneliformis geosporum]